MSAITPSSPEYGIQQNVVDHYPPTVRVVRHLLSFLQWRFSLLPRGAYHWEPEGEDSPDGQESEIYIAGDTPLPARAVGERPAVTVLRSQLAFQGIGIGDMAHHDLSTGGKSYSDLLPTTLAVNVLSRLPMVAERLAWFVQEQIFTLREDIIREEKCIIWMGQRTTITPPSPAGALVDSQESDWIAVAIYLPMFLQHRTSFTPINVPAVEKIDVRIQKLSLTVNKG
jgi:hypothetical protein